MTTTKKVKACPKCKDSGWVCEVHPNRPFEHYLLVWPCGGAGMPCSCNTHNPPWNYPDKTRIEVRHEGK